MFKRFDKFVGRHMGVKRWIVAWSLLLTASIMLMVKYGGLVIAVGTPVAAMALFMAAGNMRRLCDE